MSCNCDIYFYACVGLLNNNLLFKIFLLLRAFCGPHQALKGKQMVHYVMVFF